MADRKRGTSIRPLSRVLDAIDSPAWMIDPAGDLCYLSAACEPWLGVDIDRLLGRSTLLTSATSPPAGESSTAARTEADRTEADRAVDRMVRALAAPPGLSDFARLHRSVHPPPIGSATQTPPAEQQVLFLSLGGGADHVLALAGQPPSSAVDADQLVAAEIHGELLRWQQQLPSWSQLACLVGESDACLRLRRQLRLAAACQEHLLLVGPEGSGRESAALAIHRQRQHRRFDSSRPTDSRPAVRDATWAVVDGALMDAELLDATLGALMHRLGEDDEAHGTVLVQNLDQMPFEAQSRLEQICQRFERTLCLMGMTVEGLDRLQESGRLDSALAQRLAVYAIGFVPLAGRASDIPAIASLLLQLRRQSGEGTAQRFNRQSLDALVMYPWPGDLRELEAAVRHAVRTATGSAILPAHLPLAVRSYRPSDPAAKESASIDLDRSLQRLERRLITQALERAEGNRAEAARLLNISRGRLLRKIDEYDIGEAAE
ncbi:AAA-type ATPase lid domain-containing protein [Roseimaritima sediminicola]|uniref:helix-turn-helix domain-containing protein n=1 Tax=Roseimaritima sediminicola TaxID=2662066 RepID=UPI001298420A|nr:helix-turn-helix domain-containing protein [Roseimaritima sediminicola]